MSVNQSTSESATSSLQRSGLSITVGDTKSIVLALQALQSKIRSLEQDRDFHQDQYDASLQAHERYKLDMERQMEEERATHRAREAELLELVRKAREERAELEDALNGNKQDLGGFRKELEDMITAEKDLALQRESKLNREVAKLRDDIREEQTRRAALLVTVDKLKEEREAAVSTNEQLRVAMDDLLTRYEQLQRQRHLQPPEHPRAAPVEEMRRRPSGRSAGGSGGAGGVRGGSARVSAAAAPPSRAVVQTANQRRASRTTSPAFGTRDTRPARPRVPSCNSHYHTYEDPTCNSILRDVRVVPDEAPPCVYPSANSSMQQQQQHSDGVEAPSSSHHHSPHGDHNGARANCGCPSARRTTSARGAAPQQRTAPSHNNGVAAARTASQPRRSSARRDASYSRPPANSAAHSHTPLTTAALGSTAMLEVEKQVRHELAELQQQYEDTVDRGSSEEIPQEVLAAALHRISALIDQKKEQLKLLNEARVELESAIGAGGGGGAGGSPGGGPAPGEDKLTRRTMLVNELRSLLAEASR